MTNERAEKPLQPPPNRDVLIAWLKEASKKGAVTPTAMRTLCREAAIALAAAPAPTVSELDEKAHIERMDAIMVELWAAKSLDLHMCDGTVRQDYSGLLRDIRESWHHVRSALAAAPASPVSVVGPSGKTDAEVLNSIVLPMVRERSLETGDTWDQASNALEAAISAYTHPAPTAPMVSGEPVAWLRVRDDGRQTFWERNVDGACTPLYTHPATTRAGVLEEAIRAQPPTHVNPTETPYDRGYFNAVQDYVDAIRALGEKP